MRTSYREIAALVWKMRSRLLTVGAVVAIFTFCFMLLIHRTNFLARAAITAPHTTAGSALQALGQQEGISPVVIFLSQRVLREVVEEVGLHVSRKQEIRALLSQRIHDNLFAEWGKLPEGAPPTLIQKVVFEGGLPITLSLNISPKGKVKVESLDGQFHAEGKVGGEIRMEGLSFHVVKEATAYAGEEILLEIVPWNDVVEELKRRLQVKADPHDKRLLRLTAPGRSRQEAEKILEVWIAAYKRMLKHQADSVANAISGFAKEHGSELRGQLERLIHRRSHEMQHSLQTEGWMGVQQELTLRLKPKKDVRNRLIELQERKEKLTQHEAMHSSSYLSAIQKELEEVAGRIQQAGEIKEAIVHGKEVSGGALIEECGLLLSGNSGNRDLSRINALLEREKKRRSFLQEELARPAPAQIEELKSAEESMKRCEEELHTAKDDAANLKSIEEAVGRGDVEPTALGRILNDPVGVRQMDELQALTSKLSSPHLTSFERKRISEQRQKLCEAMSGHLGDLLQLSSWKTGVLQNRRAALRSRLLELIDNESELMKKRLVKAGEGMEDLSEKWRGETLFLQERDALMTASRDLIRQSAGQLISCRLPMARLLTLDLPFSPYKPQKPHLFLISLMSGFFGMCVAFAYAWNRSRDTS